MIIFVICKGYAELILHYDHNADTRVYPHEIPVTIDKLQQSIVGSIRNSEAAMLLLLQASLCLEKQACNVTLTLQE